MGERGDGKEKRDWRGRERRHGEEGAQEKAEKGRILPPRSFLKLPMVCTVCSTVTETSSDIRVIGALEVDARWDSLTVIDVCPSCLSVSVCPAKAVFGHLSPACF